MKTKTLAELNNKYPERRHKSKTIVIDWQGIESKRFLNKFEKECLASITVAPSGEMRLLVDLRLMIDKFPGVDKIIMQKRQEGWTEQEIADLVNKARRTIIRRLNTLFGKLKKILK